MIHKQRVVIVGGGFGGLAAAKALARSDAEVLVVDKHNKPFILSQLENPPILLRGMLD